MKRFLLFAAAFTGMLTQCFAQCEVTGSVTPDTIVCGSSAVLAAYGQGPGLPLLSENFNNGTYGPGWNSTQQAMFNNPCSPNGVDGTKHIWFGNTSPVPRSLTTATFNLSSCTNAGVTICFDFLMATQGNSAPCEGPDEPDEGVYLQYSTNNGSTWTTIHYFDPTVNNSSLINWNNWCFSVPAAALTSNTIFRWFQDNDSGADYDHWGLDNVVIYCNDPTFDIVWQHDNYSAGPLGGVDPTPVAPHTTTSYIVVMSNGTITCRDTVQLIVRNPTLIVNAGADTSICAGTCVQLNATAKTILHPAKTPTYENHETVLLQPGATNTTMNISVTGLNMPAIGPGSVTSVCINSLSYFGFQLFPPGQADIGDLALILTCPSGQSITLVPANVTSSTGAGYTNTCFVPVGGNNISTGTAPYTGSWASSDPFSNLYGCTPNGLWSLTVQVGGLGFGTGSFSNWSISFDDPEVSAPANFSWSPTTNMTGSTTSTPTVCPPPTNYTLTASDTAGCITASDAVNVTTHVCCTFGIGGTVTQPSCGASNGSINVTPQPAGTYTYAWADGPVTQNRTNLPAGSYHVTVTETSTSCSKDTIFTLTNNSNLNITLGNIVSPTCAGNDGQLTATLAGGSPLYTITIDTNGTTAQTVQSPVTGSQTVPGLPAGTIIVHVTDGQGCQAADTAVLAAPVNCCVFSIGLTVTQPSCGANNGSVTAAIQNGSGNYTYVWSNGSTFSNAANLGAGPISVTVTDNVQNCTKDTTINLNSNSTLAISFSNQVNPGCSNNNGSVTATLSGGTAPYNITVDTNGTTAQTATSPVTGSLPVNNLPAGTITVSVTDGQGCQASNSFTLTINNTLSLSFGTPVNPTCAGNDGSVTATLAGGTAPYTVTIDTGGTPQSFQLPVAGAQNITNLPAGSITVTVTDAQGCSATASATLTAPANCCTFTISAALAQPACAQSDGGVTLTTANGSGNYSYNWANGLGTDSAITSQPAGNYAVTITDNGYANCFIDTTFSLTNPNAPVINNVGVVNETCPGSADGLAWIEASGGSGNFTYAWADGQTTDTAVGLTAGTPGFTVTDGAGCQATGTATVQSGFCCTLQTSATAVPPACGQTTGSINVTITTAGVTPYQYSIDGINYQASPDFSNVPQGTYNVITEDGGNCHDTVSVTIPQGGANLSISITPVNASCFGAGDGSATAVSANGNAPFTYSWNTGATTDVINNLVPGAYTVTVADGAGCTGTATASVTQPAALSINLGNDLLVCEGTTVTIDAGSGYAAYAWNSNETTQTISPVAAGNYAVTVTDTAGCTATDDIFVDIIPTPQVDLGDDKIAYEGDHVALIANISGNTNGATFTWQPDTLLSCGTCQNPAALAIDTITYILQYTDQNGCVASDDINLFVLPVKEIFWPNAFSPNGDGNNDIFLPYGSDVKEIKWSVFNRWGEKVFESTNFFRGWDGTFKGVMQGPQVFIYTAEATMMNNTTKKFKGAFTLIR